MDNQWLHVGEELDSDDDDDSLFDEPISSRTTDAYDSVTEKSPADDIGSHVPARRTAPPICGLFFDPSIRLDKEFADELMWICIRKYFQSGSVNQVMLFERAPALNGHPEQESTNIHVSNPDDMGGMDTGLRPRGGLPSFLCDLLQVLNDLLRPLLPPKTHALLFPPPTASVLARQAILNLYWPGEGITPHVDLLDRFGDGIIGVSLGSGCVMDFEKTRIEHPAVMHFIELHKSSPEDSHSGDEASRYHGVYLPEGSVIVLSEEARYLWTHGIAYRAEDLVEQVEHHGSEVESRNMRLSITFRWLLPGADIVGGSGCAQSESDGSGQT